MKKFPLLYLSIAIVSLFFVSCLESDDDFEIKPEPYAMLRSLTIADISTTLSTKTEDGRDSTFIRITPGVMYQFNIDQENRLVYNTDSLPVGTDITRVVTDIKCDGIAYIYADSIENFRLFSNSDSIDYTKPARLLIIATDNSYMREYTVKLNVHTVDPDKLNWVKSSAVPVEAATEMRLFEKDGSLALFSVAENGAVSYSSAALPTVSEWTTMQIDNFPAGANMNSMTLFGGNYYVVAGGKLYVSADASSWTEVAAGNNFVTLFAASDEDNVMWAAVNDSLAYTSDVASGFTMVEPLPSGFPLYGLSSSVNALRTNMKINRYLLIGRSSETAYAQPVVWSKLTAERSWTQYRPSSYNEKLCPSLQPLIVLPYNAQLYAFGGKGVVNGKEVESMSAIYVSRDNGLTWSATEVNAPELPAEVASTEAPIAATVDSNENIWLVVAGGNGTIWRGRMNKFDLK